MPLDVDTLRGRRADDRWNRMAVGDLLERVTWATPDKTAFIGWDGAYGEERFARLSYAQADAAANQVAHALIDAGLSSGDRVLLYCDNSVEAIVTFFGIAKAGLVAVPVNPMLATDVLTWAIEHVEPAAAIVDAAFGDRAAEIFGRAGLPILATIEIGGSPVPGTPGFGAWIDGRPTGEVDVTIHGDDIWALLFTSGTTSMPKAAMVAHSYSYLAAYSYAMSLTRGLAVESDLVMATFLPIVYHCGHNSTVMPAIISGGTVLIGRRPDEHALAEAITRERVTAVWAGSPLWVDKLVAVAEVHSADVYLSSLTVAMFSWGAMSPDLSERITRVCGPQAQMLEVFGQTESQSCLRFWPVRHPVKHEQSLGGVNHVGWPTPILAADVQDERGRSLRGQVGVAGEAVYRSPFITAGYYRNAEATAEAFAGGWFHSGDSCAYDDDGGQIMLDRFKDMVKSGGENVSSLRVEGVLQEHPDVERVAVIGLPDPTWGELVTAVVLLRPGAETSAETLIGFARERLAGYESPKRLVFVDRFPETVGGKIMKHRLRAELSGTDA